MPEPPELSDAREHLARAESGYRTPDGLFHLEEGLALLEDVMAAGAAEHRTVARNLASTYAARIITRMSELVDGDRALPEPDMEHLFKAALAFDHIDIELPAQARALKLRLARRLIDRYYEGHAPEVKERALDEFAKLAAGDARRRRKPRKR